MAINRVSLVTESLLTRFNALSRGDTSARGGGSNTPGTVSELGSALRIGSRAYVSAFDNLNSAFAALNISETALTGLNNIVDEMITIVDQAKSSSASRQKRINLDSDFRDLVTDFQKIVGDTELNGINLLTKDGIEALLTSVGLDEESSSSIAAALEKIVIPTKEDSLVSEKQEGARPIRLPKVEVQEVTTYLDGYGSAVSSAAAIDRFGTGYVASGYNVYQQDDTGTSTYQTVVIETEDGGTVNELTVTVDATLLAVNNTNGYSVIESSEDFLGFNALNNPNLFLVNNQGSVVQQITDNQSDASLSFTGADISNDNLSVVYGEIDGSTGDIDVRVSTVTAFGTNPNTATVTDFETVSSGNTVDDVKISGDGNYVAFSRTTTSEAIRFYDVATQTVDAYLSGVSNNETFGFLADNKLAVVTGNGNNDQIREYTYNDSAFGATIASGSNVSALATVEKDDNYSYAVAYRNATNGDLYVADENGDQLQRVNLESSVTNISLSRSLSGSVALGATGYFEGASGDDQLYRFEQQREANLSSPPSPTRTAYSAGDVSDVAFGDFNNDGNVDVVSVDTTNGYLNLNTGNGNGTLNTVVTEDLGLFPGYLAVSDFNGDGNLDVAAANTDDNNVSIILGNGDGTFVAQASFTTGSFPSDLQIGDFDNDGDDDLAVVDSGGSSFSILLGNGDGTFATRVSYALGTNPSELSIGDFTNDGVLDVAVSNFGDNSISIYSGDGDGTFTVGASFSTGNGPSTVFAADFNLDGNVDIATLEETDSTISLYLGNGDGSFGARTSFSVSGVTSPNSFTAVDYNGDSFLDLLATGSGTNELLYLQGNGDGSFSAAVSFGTSGGGLTAVGATDLNKDGVTDLVAVANNADGINVLMTETQANTSQSTISTTTSSLKTLPAGDQSVSAIFDLKRSLADRADAYYLASDLEALKEQIEENIEAVQEIKDVVGANIDVARSAANSFLDRAETLNSNSEADTLARLLSNQIRREVGPSATYVQDLESIAIAGLIADGTLEL